MNAKPTFIPSISKWKIECFRNKTKRLFCPAVVNWEDCYCDVDQANFQNEEGQYTLDGKKLVLFESYDFAIAWMKVAGLRLCDDLGKPLTSDLPDFDLEKEFNPGEKDAKEKEIGL